MKKSQSPTRMKKIQLRYWIKVMRDLTNDDMLKSLIQDYGRLPLEAIDAIKVVLKERDPHLLPR